jgi:hypothetical protein
MLTRSGILLIKLWFSVGQAEQRTRFMIRQIDPVRRCKLSPTDLASLDKWGPYTDAKEAMFAHTDTEHAPWAVVKSTDKKRAHRRPARTVYETGENRREFAGAASWIRQPTCGWTSRAVSGACNTVKTWSSYTCSLLMWLRSTQSRMAMSWNPNVSARVGAACPAGHVHYVQIDQFLDGQTGPTSLRGRTPVGPDGRHRRWAVDRLQTQDLALTLSWDGRMCRGRGLRCRPGR